MIVRYFTDNGYVRTHDENIELVDTDFIEESYIEKAKGFGQIYKWMLSEAGLAKLQKLYSSFDWQCGYTGFEVISESQLMRDAENEWRRQYYKELITDCIINNKPVTAIEHLNTITDKCPITEKYLEHYCWEKKTDNVTGDIYYIYVVKDNVDNVIFSITLQKGLSNYCYRDWTCHIDNCDFESIANADIDTIEQFNMLMRTMSIPYHLY